MKNDVVKSLSIVVFGSICHMFTTPLYANGHFFDTQKQYGDEPPLASSLEVPHYRPMITLRTPEMEPPYIDSRFGYEGPTIIGTIPMRSWDAIRYTDIVKQEYDFSCGAAAMATILRYYYNLNITEADILAVINKFLASSFADLANAAKVYRMQALGLSLTYEQLTKLKIPVIAHLKYGGLYEHFSVISGITDDWVELADPLLGRTKLTKYQFIDIWNMDIGGITKDKTTTESDDIEQQKGYILIIVPEDEDMVKINQAFFQPPYPTIMPANLLDILVHR